MHFEEKEDNIKISDIVPDIHLCIETHASKSNLLAKMCQILVVWFGRSILDTFLIISWDSVHIFQNRFLCWNRESEPVNLNTMNPIIRPFFFHL